jgi:hypothetical protein
MKPLKDLREISRMLAASPDLPAPNGTTATVQPGVFFNRLDQLLEVGMGLPVASFVQSNGVHLKLFFSLIAEDANIFIPTPKPLDFLEEVRMKIVTAI